MIKFTDELYLDELNALVDDTDWKDLLEAHRLMRQGYVTNSMQIYRELLSENGAKLKQRFTNGNWLHLGSLEEPSLIRALILLTEYYMEVFLWQEWLNLLKRCFQLYFNEEIEPDLQNLIKLVEVASQDSTDPNLNRNEIVSGLVHALGEAQLRVMQSSLSTTISLQEEALQQTAINDFDRARHHMLLGYAFTKRREHELALEHGKLSVSNLSLAEEPYYTIWARTNLADSYDYLKEFDPAYSSIAISQYNDITQTILEQYPHLSPKIPYYHVGWALLETNHCQEAIEAFEKGRQLAIDHDLIFDRARNEYGLASALQEIGRLENNNHERFEEAFKHLQQARMVFSLKSQENIWPLMMAVCLNIEALIYKHIGEFDKGLMKAHLMLNWLETYVDDPVQKYNAHCTLIQLYKKKNIFFLAAYHESILDALGKMLKKPKTSCPDD